MGEVRVKDRWWAFGVAVAAGAVFATTLSSHVALGDAPESVAGVATLGILHAPGYPLYVILGRLFTLLIPIGSITWRTNLFSLVCADVAVVGVYRIARLVGASQAGATIGALSLATGTSFWFYADFAKHDALSALLVVLAVLCTLEWDRRGDRRLLVAAGVMVGLTIGDSWPLGLLIAPGLVVFVLMHRDRRALVGAVVGGMAAAAAMIAFVMIRAGQSPTVNWGDATTSHRLVDLLSMKDFSFVAKHAPGLAPRSAEQAGPQDAGPGFFNLLANYPELLAREFGVAALLVALWGAVASWRRLTRPHFVLLAVTIAIGVFGTVKVIGPPKVFGFTTTLVVGGFLTTIFVVLAVWLALGVTDLAARAPTALVYAAAAVIVLVPSLVVHRGVASQRQPPFADEYAANVFRSLPPNAAILTRGGEYTFSLLYDQAVHGRRPDVTVIAADSLAGSSWYRGELARRLRIPLPNLPTQGRELVAVAHLLQTRRPVYLDMLTTDALRPGLGYVARGLVSEVVDGTGPKLPDSTDPIEQLLDHDYITHGVYDDRAGRRFPNAFLLVAYVRAHLELARDFNVMGRIDKVQSEVQLALAVDPNNQTALGIMRALKARAGP